MKSKNVQKSFVENLSSLREKLSVRFPRMNVQEIRKLMGELAHFHYKKKKGMMLGESKLVYNFLIENGYNPFTVYRWMLLERLPEELRFMIKERKISQKIAISEGLKWRNETTESLGENIMVKGLRLIERM